MATRTFKTPYEMNPKGWRSTSCPHNSHYQFLTLDEVPSSLPCKGRKIDTGTVFCPDNWHIQTPKCWALFDSLDWERFMLETLDPEG